MAHDCPGKGCNRRVRDDLLACLNCWRKVSKETRRRLLDAWAHGRTPDLTEYVVQRRQAIDEMNRDYQEHEDNKAAMRVGARAKAHRADGTPNRLET